MSTLRMCVPAPAAQRLKRMGPARLAVVHRHLIRCTICRHRFRMRELAGELRRDTSRLFALPSSCACVRGVPGETAGVSENGVSLSVRLARDVG